MRSLLAALVLLLFGCAAPCEATRVLTAFEHDSKACIALLNDEQEILGCLQDAAKEHREDLERLGEDAKDVIRAID